MNSTEAKELRKQHGQAASNCMLEQYGGVTTGVGIGMLLGIRQRSMRPFIVGVTAGTLADLVMGYNGPCKEHFEKLNEAQKAYELAKVTEEAARSKQQLAPAEPKSSE